MTGTHMYLFLIGVVVSIFNALVGIGAGVALIALGYPAGAIMLFLTAISITVVGLLLLLVSVQCGGKHGTLESRDK